MTVPLQSHEVVASNRIASVLHIIAFDQIHVEPSVHLATGGQKLYTMIVVYNSDDDDGMTRTFQRLGVSADQ